MNNEIMPFRLAIPEATLADLHARLDATRWPEKETVEGWQQGVPLEDAQALCRFWRESYDWRRCETMLNGFGQYRTRIDDLDIHFLHVRSPVPNALPLLITHGWPGSVIEFHKVIGPLTRPDRHGHAAQDAFHIVAPSLPGYGFSGRPTRAGWSIERTAQAWITLMRRLGYGRFVAQGGDWGSIVTSEIGACAAPEVAAIHLNMAIAAPTEAERETLSRAEEASLADLHRYQTELSGYAFEQGTRPQTLGYGLTDSPAGQAAWIFEKFREWTDCNGDPLSVLSYDELLDNIMLYWLTATAFYWESRHGPGMRQPKVPVGVSVFPRELFRPSRRWVERSYPTLAYWNEPPRGGHFAAFEQPELFAQELRNAFRPYR